MKRRSARWASSLLVLQSNVVHGQVDCRSCCDSSLYEGSLPECCGGTPALEGRCLGLPCCINEPAIVEAPTFFPCLGFETCQEQQETMCRNTDSRSFFDDFTCAGDCCSIDRRATNAWTPIGSEEGTTSGASIWIDPNENEIYFFDQDELQEELKQVLVQVPATWGLVNLDCFVDGNYIQKSVFCEQVVFNGNTFILVTLEDHTFTAFHLQISTFEPLDVSAPDTVSIFYLFASDHKSVFAGTLFVARILPAFISKAIFYSNDAFPGFQEPRSSIVFTPSIPIPAGGVVTAAFSNNWIFTNPEWRLQDKIGRFFMLTGVPNGNVWSLTIPSQVEGQLNFTVSSAQTPSLPDLATISIAIFSAQGEALANGVVTGSPATLGVLGTADNQIYNIISLSFCLVALLFVGGVTRFNGLTLSVASVWTDYTALSAIFTISISLANNSLWLLVQDIYYAFIARIRLAFVFTLMLSVVFHWGSVLSLRLRKVQAWHSHLIFWILNASFAAFQIIILVFNYRVIEAVYDTELDENLLQHQLCKLTEPSAYAHGISDIQPFYYDCYPVISTFLFTFEIVNYSTFGGLTLVMMAFGIKVIALGVKMLNHAHPSEYHSLRKTVFFYALLIVLVTFIYGFAFLLNVVLVKTAVDYTFWYIFAVWCPDFLAPCLLIFLQWNMPALQTLRRFKSFKLDLEYYNIQTPNLRFSEPEQWKVDAEDGAEVDDLPKKTKTMEKTEDLKNIGVSLKFETAYLVAPGSCHIVVEACHSSLNPNEPSVWKRVEDTESCLFSTQDVDENAPIRYQFVTVPQLPLINSPTYQIRFKVYDDQNIADQEEVFRQSITGPNYVNSDALVQDLFNYESDEDTGNSSQWLNERSDKSYNLQCICIFKTDATELLNALEMKMPLQLHGSENMPGAKLYINTLQGNRLQKSGDRVSKQYYIKKANLVVVEDITESAFSNDVPSQVIEVIVAKRSRELQEAQHVLRCFDEYLQTHVKPKVGGRYEVLIDRIQDNGDRKQCRAWMVARIERITAYIEVLRKARRNCALRTSRGIVFKSSREKTNYDNRMLPVNLHLQEMWVGQLNEEDETLNPNVIPTIYETITVGAMAAHALKFKNGGLRRMIANRDKLGSKTRTNREQYRQFPNWSEDHRMLEDLDWDIQERLDIVFPQAMATLVTSFCRKIDLALQHADVEHGSAMLDILSHLGYLYQIESLLSTHGKEIGMIEDMHAATLALHEVKFILIPENQGSSSINTLTAGVISVQIYSSMDRALGNEESRSSPDDEFIVVVRVRCGAVKLPERLASQGAVPVIPMLFTQGINEKQTLANATGASIIQLQDDINAESLSTLISVVQQYTEYLYISAYASYFEKKEELSKRIQLVKFSISRVSDGERRKRPDILQHSSALCRALGAGRITVCKSAKDRTSMSVTLEQGKLLERNHKLPSTLTNEVVAVMRSNGVRIENAFKNTGKRMFAFNALQRSLLPEEYRCPPRSGGSNDS